MFIGKLRNDHTEKYGGIMKIWNYINYTTF